MKCHHKTLVMLAALVALLLSSTASPLDLESPMLLVTAEYTPYEDLVKPEVVGLFKEYKVAICVCVRADQVDDKLDRLYSVYEDAGVGILFWPMLPLEDGLYVNKKTTGVYLDYLDVLFDWADSHGHKIEAIVVDVEPSYVPPTPGEEPPGLLQNVRRVRKDMGKESFDASIPEFEKIVDKLHEHDCLAVAAAFPFVIDDRLKGRHGWEDLTGGPVATIDWDYLAIMMYSSWFVEYGGPFGVDWDVAHHLTYDYSRDLKEVWGEKAAVAVGVTNPGQGGETTVYPSAEMIGPALAAVKAAGIDNVGIYDLKGILESDDPESWFRTLAETGPALPDKGKAKAKSVRRLLRALGWVLERVR